MFVYDRKYNRKIDREHNLKSNRKIDMEHNLKYDRISDRKSYCKSYR